MATRGVRAPAGTASVTVKHRIPAWITRESMIVVAIALTVLGLHLATNGQYGFHRDSLYYLDSARHPAFGYVDYPPLTPMIARLSLDLFGASVWGLRLWPSLAGASMVLLAALIARELGGGRTARLLAAIGAATSLLMLGSNWLFQTVTFDQLMWVTTFWLFARLLRTHDHRLWVALGVAVGLGLETKYTIVSLIVGLLAGTLATPLRRELRTAWPWLGAGIALLIFTPNLVWQITNHWPSIEYTFNHQSSQSADFSPLSYLSDQLALIGPVAIPLWIAGLWWLLSGATRRPLGVAAIVAFTIFLFVGKAYYAGPLDPVLLAAGACALEGATRSRRRWLPHVTAIALGLQALALLPLALPLVPEGAMARSSFLSQRKDFADTVGWPDLVHQVATVYDLVPSSERARTLLLTNNYGEAGAIDTYGPALGLPGAYSGELTYYYWEPSRLDGPVITVGFDPSFVDGLFEGCSVVATVSNPYGLHNDEFGAPIELCARSKLSLQELWPQLKSFQ